MGVAALILAVIGLILGLISGVGLIFKIAALIFAGFSALRGQVTLPLVVAAFVAMDLAFFSIIKWSELVQNPLGISLVGSAYAFLFGCFVFRAKKRSGSLAGIHKSQQ